MHMRFIAAVPNYNHGKSLIPLIDQLIGEKLDAIYVLDDSSTDNSLKLLEQYKDKVTIVKGPYNMGPAGNRNRILPYLKNNDILMSIDADMILETKGVKKIITDLFGRDDSVVLIGGGIYSNGQPMTYNYSLHQSSLRHGIGIFFERIAQILHFKPLVRLVRPLAKPFTYNVEIRFFEPQERIVDSVSEAHYYIKGDEFKRLHGYDERLRYHEGTELGYRLRKSGKSIMFTPAVWATHLEIHPRGKKLRQKEAKKLDNIIKNE